VQDELRALVAPRLADFDVAKLFLVATHTHTAPGVVDLDWYPAPGPGVMQPSEYRSLFLDRVSEAVVEAWEARRPGGVSWALGHAAVGYNRRVAYDDGTAQMYGATDTPSFRSLEGGHDHGAEMLFCWSEAGDLTGAVLNVACPSQVVEGKSYVSADFWGVVRRELRTRYSADLHVLPLTGAAGDQSPRDLVRRGRGEQDMRDESGMEEMGIRIADAFDHVYPAAQGSVKTQVVFRHLTEDLALPMRKVTQKEADEARSQHARLAADPPPQGSADWGRLRHCERLLKRYEEQTEAPVFQMELHVMRIGETALVTNPFELYLDYGLRMKARSRALHTFVVQLACDSGGYLPTEKGVAGGGYGARAADGRVGPEGGQVLVNRTVELIDELWD
jgi:hypothetical protein